MTTVQTPDITGLLSAHGMAWFVAGMATQRFIIWLSDRRAKRRNPGQPYQTPIRSLIIAYAVIGVSVLYIATQTWQARVATLQQASQMRALASETIRCQQQFNEALAARNKLYDRYDKLAAAERKALQDYISSLAVPPANIAVIHTTDPQYQAWASNLVNQFNDQLEDTARKRQAVATELASKPLPVPTCGVVK